MTQTNPATIIEAIGATGTAPSVDPISAFLSAVESATIADCDVWTDATVVDATVPNWRFTIRGATAVKEEYARWFAAPGRFRDLRRIPFADGEVVEYVLTWEEGGVPHAAHHVHILAVTGGRILADTVMCGGRWSATLLAQMGEAADA